MEPIMGHIMHYRLTSPAFDIPLLAVKPPTNALHPIILDNVCILCITATAGTELADAYSIDTIITSFPGKKVLTCYSPIHHWKHHFSSDLHVLGMPLAFIPSQDRTLHEIHSCITYSFLVRRQS
ncbi:hypothetical protein SAY86_000708 [Trapa natans]|uniref:Uncharacterized protein n=1 Tax=Trapa natans TaxID=22666 RepID=A0AAN7RGW5_TRANT|nr:hypothetical protein SAY86_000708 [Trapa natans]